MRQCNQRINATGPVHLARLGIAAAQAREGIQELLAIVADMTIRAFPSMPERASCCSRRSSRRDLIGPFRFAARPQPPAANRVPRQQFRYPRMLPRRNDAGRQLQEYQRIARKLANWPPVSKTDVHGRAYPFKMLEKRQWLWGISRARPAFWNGN
jgi:hypothetical protein